jgi:sulfite reductase (NADPH) flavoprotein alpha-component
MSDTATKPAASPYNKNNPFLAKITSKALLNKPGSEKETRHIVVNIAGSGLQYSPGYSLGVFGTNDPAVADELLSLLGLDPAAPFAQKDGSSKSLRDLLIKEYTLNRAGTKLVKALAEKLPAGATKDRFAAIVADEAKLSEYVFSRDVLEVFQDSGYRPASAEELLEMLNKSVPRLYSIASSQAKHPDEIHLTVAIVRYETHGRKKKGLASGYLADHTTLGENNVPVFLAPNKHFKLPDDPKTPIIMVGPGTGIAPFRAFLEQREMDGATGPNWLFFGDQRREFDFLYEDEFTAWQASGLLTKLSTAFSRDQAQKIYVQDRMRENAAELWQWLQKGAYFYVCGDAKRMAKDVHQTLITIAQEQGGMSLEAATEYIEKTLAKEERRYLRDVY